MRTSFEDFDLTDFWEQSEYASEKHVSEPLTDELVRSIQAELGYRIPDSYIELMRTQNGGVIVNQACPCSQRTSWSGDHVGIYHIKGIGRTKPYSLSGEIGSQFMMEEWEYPDIGIYFGGCPAAGHDMICLDYRECGRTGEPQVVHVDQEDDYKITFLAQDFEAFVKMLVSEDAYHTDDPVVFESGFFDACGNLLRSCSHENPKRISRAGDSEFPFSVSLRLSVDDNVDIKPHVK